VPDGFPGYSLPVPHPAEGRLYVRLRDDPGVINLAALEIEQLPPSPDELARAAARHAAVVEDDQTVSKPQAMEAAPSAIARETSARGR
jgi:hypothetical protein